MLKLMDEKNNVVWLILFLIGLFSACYSTLPVLDPESPLWRNDEGYFISLAKSGERFFDIRYGFFLTLSSILFFGFGDFLAIFLYKTLLLVIFMFFFRKVVDLFGMKKFFALYLVFLYLGLFFLRDVVIFIGSLAVIIGGTGGYWKIAGRPLMGLGVLVLLRPHALLVYVKSWATIIATIIFLLFFRPFFAVKQLPDTQYLILADFWKEVLYGAILIINGLNPLTKLGWYFSNQMYFPFLLLFFASIVLWAVLIQTILAPFNGNFFFRDWSRVLVGMVAFLVMYSALGIEADSRVFLCSFCPFVVFVNENLIRPRYLFAVVGLMMLMVMGKPLVAATLPVFMSWRIII